MAVILKSDTLQKTTIPKMIETRYGFLLNGQYYNKDTLTPITLEQLLIEEQDRMVLNTNKKSFFFNSYINVHQEWDDDTIIADKYEPDVSYIILYKFDNPALNTSQINNCIILKVKEANSTIQVINKVKINYGHLQYLGQSEKYLYYRMSGYPYDSSFMHLFYIDKQTLESTMLFNSQTNDASVQRASNHLSITVLYEDIDYIYIAFNSNRNSNNNITYAYVSRINKNTNTFQNISRNDLQLTDAIKPIFDSKDVFKISDGIYGLYMLAIRGTTETTLNKPLKLLKLNIYKSSSLNAMVTLSDINFTWTEEIKYLKRMVEYYLVKYKTFITKTSDKSYLNVIIYKTQEWKSNLNGYIPYQGIYTFEIVDYQNLKFVNYNQITDKTCLQNCLLTEDRRVIVVPAQASIFILKFNATKQRYEVINKLDTTTTKWVGLDTRDRMWLLKEDNELDLYSLNETTDVTIKFERDYYDYAGKSIETYITVTSKDFNGNYVATTLELTINGNAKFKSNNSKVVEITTPEDNSMDIPVIITGPNQITIYPLRIEDNKVNFIDREYESIQEAEQKSTKGDVS